MDIPTRPPLPDDIIHEITDTFGCRSGRNDLIRLLSVSRNVKAWAESRVFSKIILKSSEQVLAFSAALHGKLHFCSPSRHVKLLWILCTDTNATEHLSDVPVLCPNLVHFAFDGRRAPFSGVHDGNKQPYLTRLSICSPSLLDDEFYRTGPPVPWKNLTHLHILGPCDIDGTTHYNALLGRNIDKLVSLKHLYIELTYPSPETERLQYTLFAESALFYLFLEENLIRDLLNRLPELRRVVIKTNFAYQRFKVLWNELVTKFRDEPRVVFEQRTLQNQEYYEVALPISSLSKPIWHTLLHNALEEADRLWMMDS